MSFLVIVFIIVAVIAFFRIYRTYREKSESDELLRQASRLTPEQTKQRISECKAALCCLLVNLKSPNAFNSLYSDNIKKIAKILKIMNLHISMLKGDVSIDDCDYEKRAFNYLLCNGILTADRFWKMHAIDKKDELWKAEDWTLIFGLSDLYGTKYDKILDDYLNIEFDNNPYSEYYDGVYGVHMD